MQSRLMLAAVAVPLALVLVIVLMLARPRSTAPASTSAAGAAIPQPALSATSGAPDTTIGQAQPSMAGAAPTASAQPSPAPTPLPEGPPAPGFDGGGAWLNSPPLTLAELTGQGKVILVNFWTYGCFNCQNTLPYVKQWWEKYKDQGLVIVGVHTPEFSSEHVLDNVRSAVEREGIGWPVVQDNDYAIWRAYGNNYWPRFYLVDHRGQIVYDHIGEGAYEETDRRIAAALAAAHGQ